MRTHPTRRRGGFTLVELLVAAALVILIMSILAGAFTAALDSLSLLRSIGGLAERTRSAHTQLRNDLDAAHFNPGDSTSSTRTSDIRYDSALAAGTQAAPPPGGFLFIRQANGSTFEGLDQDNVFSTRADGTAGHVLGMTSRRTGKTPDQLYTADLSPIAANPALVAQFLAQNSTDTAPANTFVSNWAEIYWFLGNEQQLGGNKNYTLYRRVRLLTTTPIDFPTATGLEHVVSCYLVTPPLPNPPFWRTNTIDSIRVPANRLYAAPSTNPSAIPITSAKYGDDIVLSNVISFEVKPTWRAANPVNNPRTTTLNPGLNVAIPAGAGAAIQNGDYPFDDLPLVTENTNPVYTGQRVFDTWAPADMDGVPATNWFTPGSPDSIPFRARVTGVKVKFRVFDVKTQQTRQSSLIVDL